MTDEQVNDTRLSKEPAKVFDAKTGFTIPVFSEEKLIFDIEEPTDVGTPSHSFSIYESPAIAQESIVAEPNEAKKNFRPSYSLPAKKSSSQITSLCLCFHVHQPFKLRSYHFNEIGENHFYENHEKNLETLNRLCDQCYLPANQLLLDLIQRYEGNFRVSFVLSGTAIEQFVLYRPDVIESFKSLVETGCVELLGTTYYQSLSFLYSENEFRRQAEKHRGKLNEIFNSEPKVFCNAELIYRNDLASLVRTMGFKAMLVEGADLNLENRSPNFIYQASDAENFVLLLRNFSLSDDIASRFNDRDWNFFPLTAQKFSAWIHDHKNNADVINLFMPYHTFSKSNDEETSILEFLKVLPGAILNDHQFSFGLPSEIIEVYEASKTYNVPDYLSKAEEQHDLSPWTGNEMQQQALEKIYALEQKVLATQNEDLISVWGKLQTADHFKYMETQSKTNDSSFASPYDACLYYMNVLSDLEQTVDDSLHNSSS
jgi:alpha-amylase